MGHGWSRSLDWNNPCTATHTKCLLRSWDSRRETIASSHDCCSMRTPPSWEGLRGRSDAHAIVAEGSFGESLDKAERPLPMATVRFVAWVWSLGTADLNCTTIRAGIVPNALMRRLALHARDRSLPCSSAPTSDLGAEYRGSCGGHDVGGEPIIVGGLPGSSTRGMAELLKRAGVFMGHMFFGGSSRDLLRCPRTARQMWDVHRAFNRELDFTLGREPDMSRKLMLSAKGQLAYALADAPPALQSEVRLQTCTAYGTLRAFLRSCIAETLNGSTGPCAERLAEVSPLLAHGWKHGATMFMLPVYFHVFGRGFRFLHVVRDGRDIAFSSNRVAAKKLRHLCGRYPVVPAKGACQSAVPSSKQPHWNPKVQILVWAIANVGVLRMGRFVLGTRYTFARIEDFMTADGSRRRRAIQQLLEQLELRGPMNFDRLAGVFDDRIGFRTPQSSSIGGESGAAKRNYSGKWMHYGGEACVAEMMRLPVVCRALAEFHYIQGHQAMCG